MISFFNLLELFSAVIFADNIGSLLNNLFVFKLCNLLPVALLFRRFNFILLAIVSLVLNLLFHHHLVQVLVVNQLPLNINE